MSTQARRLTPDELQALRALVSGEPETSPARRLFGHLDALNGMRLDEVRHNFLDRQVRLGHSIETAEKMFEVMHAGISLGVEQVPCPECRGLGGLSGCDSCGGRGNVYRSKLPDEEGAAT